MFLSSFSYFEALCPIGCSAGLNWFLPLDPGSFHLCYWSCNLAALSDLLILCGRVWIPNKLYYTEEKLAEKLSCPSSSLLLSQVQVSCFSCSSGHDQSFSTSLHFIQLYCTTFHFAHVWPKKTSQLGGFRGKQSEWHATLLPTLQVNSSPSNH